MEFHPFSRFILHNWTKVEKRDLEKEKITKGQSATGPGNYKEYRKVENTYLRQKSNPKMK